MKFPWRRQARRPLAEFQIIEGSHMLQRFILDCRIAESQQLSILLGLPPMDAETAAKETAESDLRIHRATPMLPVISLLTSALTASILEYISTMSDGFLEAEESAVFLDLFNRVALSNAVGVITTLEDIGFIRYPYLLED